LQARVKQKHVSGGPFYFFCGERGERLLWEKIYPASILATKKYIYVPLVSPQKSMLCGEKNIMHTDVPRKKKFLVNDRIKENHVSTKSPMLHPPKINGPPLV